ncbi:hypothetical protein LJB77_02875 [Ruminococcaceae bacterium OttesenSCG-928-N02]|nr:hypothetical protein [Ruminococcaceae bacterium OttesenSCG-928-N02]
MRCNYIKTLPAFALLFTLLFFVACGTQPASSSQPAVSNRAIAEDFVQRVLNIPYAPLAQAAAEMVQTVSSEVPASPGVVSVDNENLNAAIIEMCGEHADGAILTDAAKTFYLDVVMAHLGAEQHGYAYTVESVEVRELGSGADNRQFIYEAQMCDNQGGTFTLSGTIQFSEANLVNYMSVYEWPEGTVF